MSRLTNISSLRIPHFSTWKTMWYEKDKNYSFLFFRDFQLYQYLKGLFYRLKMMTDDFYFENLLNSYLFIRVNIYLYRYQVKKYFLSFFISQYLVYHFLLRYFRHRTFFKSNFNILYVFSSIFFLSESKSNILFLLYYFYFSLHFRNLVPLFHTNNRKNVLFSMKNTIKRKRRVRRNIKKNVLNLKLKKNKYFSFYSRFRNKRTKRLVGNRIINWRKKMFGNLVKYRLKKNWFFFSSFFSRYYRPKKRKYKRPSKVNFFLKLNSKYTTKIGGFRSSMKRHLQANVKQVKQSQNRVSSFLTFKSSKSSKYKKSKLKSFDLNSLKNLKSNDFSYLKKIKKNIHKIKSFYLYLKVQKQIKRSRFNAFRKRRPMIKRTSVLHNRRTYLKSFLFFFFFQNLLYFFFFSNFKAFYFFSRFFSLFKLKFNLFKNSISYFYSLKKAQQRNKEQTFYYLKENFRRESSRAVYDERVYYDFFFYFFLYNLILNVERTIYLFSGNKILFLPSFYFAKKVPVFLSAKLVSDYVLTELEKGNRVYGIFKKLQYYQSREKSILKTDLRIKLNKYLSDKGRNFILNSRKRNRQLLKQFFRYLRSVSLRHSDSVKKADALVARARVQYNSYLSKCDLKKKITKAILKKKIRLINNKIKFRNNLYKRWRENKDINILKSNANTLISRVFEIRKLFEELYYNEVLAKKYPLVGLRIECNGPTRRGKQARLIAYHQVIKNYKLFGRMPNTSILADIDYYQSFARTKQGSIGIKVWIFFYSKTYDSAKKLISVI